MPFPRKSFLCLLGFFALITPAQAQIQPLEGNRVSFLMGPLYRGELQGTGSLSGITIDYETGISLEARVTTPVWGYLRLGASIGFDFAQIRQITVQNPEARVQKRFPTLSPALRESAANAIRTTDGGQHMVFSMLLRGDFEYPRLPLIPYVGGGFGWAINDGRRLPTFTLRTLGVSENDLGLGPAVRMTVATETGLRWRWQQKVLLDAGYHFSWIDEDPQGQGGFISHKFRVAFTFAL